MWVTLLPLGLTLTAVAFRACRIACYGGPMLQGYLIKSALIFVYIVLPTTANMVCSAFATYDYRDDEVTHQLMVVDMSIESGTIRHKKIQLYAVIMCMVYMFGVPAAMGLMLWTNRKVET